MADCQNLKGCAFVKEYESLPEKQLALKGFVNMYCTGERQDAWCSQIGEGGMVPVNMMPNGFPLPGTHNRDWNREALAVVLTAQRESYEKLKEV